MIAKPHKVGLTALWFLMASATVSVPATAMAQSAAPNHYVEASNAIVTAIDRFEMGRVWEMASPVMKASVPQERFIANTAQRRALLGSIRSRDWMSVMKVPVTRAEGSLPPGQYVSVRFATAGTNGRTMEEVISFHQDTDGQWRLVGYSLN